MRKIWKRNRTATGFLLSLGGSFLAALPVLGQTMPPASPCPPLTSSGTLGGSPSTPPFSGFGNTAIGPNLGQSTGLGATAPEIDDGRNSPFVSGGSPIARGDDTFEAPRPGYIDGAIPMSQFRLRVDAAYDNNRPDRAEFFYAKCGCFNRVNAAVRAPGPRNLETRVDYQEILGYGEVALGDRFSLFLEMPIRFINPEQNANETGVGDINFGLKYALIASPEQFVTFQFRTYVPTGNAERGLGTEHVSLEPAILWHRKLTDRLQLDAELRDWIAVGGTDFSGNVLRYGIGLSYQLLGGCNLRVAPVAELVGWTVLEGKELAVANTMTGDGSAVQDASGDTILNAKLGIRVGLGDPQGSGLFNGGDLYLGYGRALTGDVWYKDIIRLEYRVRF